VNGRDGTSSGGTGAGDALTSAYRRLGVRGRWAVLMTLLALSACGWWGWRLVSAAMLPSGTSASLASNEKERMEALAKEFSRQVSQFDGRTVFYVPAPPTPVATEEEKPEAEPDKTPPAPSTYGGPGIIAMINDSIWFDDGKRLTVGESEGDVKVVRVRAPWEADIAYKGVEFTVKFFERDKVVLAKGAEGSAAGSSGGSGAASPEVSGAEKKAEATSDTGGVGAGGEEAPKTSEVPVPEPAKPVEPAAPGTGEPK
jgi:hypothetical protein